MNKQRIGLGIAVISLMMLNVSCKDEQREKPEAPVTVEEHSRMDHGKMKGSGENSMQDQNEGQAIVDASGVEIILRDYLELKNSLVGDNSEEAANAGSKLVGALEEWNYEGLDEDVQQEVTEIVADAKEHAEHIAESDINHQREHFMILSQDVADLLEITGSPMKLYQQYCPMYNDNKGAMWLSSVEKVQNPYFGSKMVNCGKVQNEIL